MIYLSKRNLCWVFYIRYETPQQGEPTLDAKGVEIVRRDGCQVASKILERCVKILFEFKDVSRVRDYFSKQCVKLSAGKLNIKDFVIAKEYRGRETYDNVRSVAACQVANKALLKDPLAEPLSGERVPYVIIYGSPNRPLYELVRSPEEFLQNPELKINYEYYVHKQILPPIDRIFRLMDINVFQWVQALSFKPRIFQFSADLNQSRPGAAVTISNFIYSTDCVLCGRKRQTQTGKNLCRECARLDQNALTRLRVGFLKSEKRLSSLIKICQLCTANKSLNAFVKSDCVSLDCPNQFLILSAKQDFKKADYVRSVIEQFF